MKKLLQKTQTTLTLIVLIMTGVSTMQAQTVNMDCFITLNTQQGEFIKLKFKAAAASTLIKIVSGNKTKDIIVGTGWTNYKNYISEDKNMIIYGDIIGLDCSSNSKKLTNIDLSNNTQLKALYCHTNSIASIDVSKNTELKELGCANTNLTTLNVRNNTELNILRCFNVGLTSIDVSKNTKLKELDCSNNKLTSIDISNNKELIVLSCSNNRLTSIDVSNNIALKGLSCDNNSFSSLDISKNTKLRNLYCYNNSLTKLDISNNKELKNLYCHGNNFNTQVLDDIYCNLPNHTVEEPGLIHPAFDTSDTNHDAVKATNAHNAHSKNWKVRYYSNDSEISTNGSYICNKPSNVNTHTKSTVSIYPNPVSDILYIQSENNINSVHIYNMYGIEVASTSNTTQINLAHLPAGIYAVRIVSLSGTTMQRIVKK
ncbi:MAG: T9SS type A sorting domain-containing protein [Porphyromonadaceae bacterium]|nr:T9SS type A sorting domain-containing protein [Porphyromonadaceae bacterium]